MSVDDHEAPLEAHAEDLVSIARFGGTRTRYILLDGPWESVRQLKGPLTADHEKDLRKKLWLGERDLRLTISSACIGANDALIDRLLALSSLDRVSVDITSSVELPTFDDHVSRIIWDEPEAPETSWVSSSRSPNSFHAPHLESDWRETSAGVFMDSNVSRSEAETLFLELAAHDALDNDIFVTEHDRLLDGRYGESWFKRSGVMSPRESLTVIETWLRLQRRFIVRIWGGEQGDNAASQKPSGKYTYDKVLFYQAVAIERIGPVIRAHSSALAPERVGLLRSVAEHLGSIVTRYIDLLIARDALCRETQIEGVNGGSNLTALDQLYHLRSSVILACGCLDELAWVAALLSGESVAPAKVSWRRIVSKDPVKWVRRTECSPAGPMLEAARLHPGRPFADLLYDLRDVIQHRHPLRTGVAQIREGDHFTRATVAVVDLEASVHPKPLECADADGVFRSGSQYFALPVAFQVGITATMTKLISDVIGSIEWPDSEWWRTPEDQSWGALNSSARAAASWLYGPP